MVQCLVHTRIKKELFIHQKNYILVISYRDIIQGYNIESGKYIGDKIKIIYNPQTSGFLDARCFSA